jgi:hypothetical protein
MVDPVVAADGITYERAAITTWIAAKGTSPLTRELVFSGALFPNRVLHGEIQDWCAAHGLALRPPQTTPAVDATVGSQVALQRPAPQAEAHGALRSRTVLAPANDTRLLLLGMDGARLLPHEAVSTVRLGMDGDLVLHLMSDGSVRAEAR